MQINLPFLERCIVSISDLSTADSITSIAKKIGYTRQTVSKALEKLVEEGMLKPSVFVDPYRLGFDVFDFWGKTAKGIDLRQMEEILNRNAAALKGLYWIGRFDGPYPLVFGMLGTRSNPPWELAREVFSIFGVDPSSFRMSLRVNEYAMSRHYLAPGSKRTPPLFRGQDRARVKITEESRKLLELLESVGQRNVRELSRELKTSASTTLGRLRKLEKQGVIRGYFYKINPKQYAVVQKKLMLSVVSEPARFERVLDSYCRRNSNVTGVIRCIGSWQYEITFDEFAQGERMSAEKRIVTELGKLAGDVNARITTLTVARRETIFSGYAKHVQLSDE